MRLVDWLTYERGQYRDHGLYYNTQVLFAYHANRMAGSTLTPAQISLLFVTGSLRPGDLDADAPAADVTAAVNHFRAFDWLLGHVDDPLDAGLIGTLHDMLRHGDGRTPATAATSDGSATADAAAVPGTVASSADLDQALARCASLADDPAAIAVAYHALAAADPFADGDGRLAGLVLFKELLRIDAVPVVPLSYHRDEYARALKRFPSDPEPLTGLLRGDREIYHRMMDAYTAGRVRCSYHR